MKIIKILGLLILTYSLVFSTGPLVVSAAEEKTVDEIFGPLTPPTPISKIGTGREGLGNFFSNLIKIIYGVSGVIFLFMLIWGAVQWLTSGGDKEAIAKARGRIIHAVIGLVLLSLVFLIAAVISSITGFKIF